MSGVPHRITIQVTASDRSKDDEKETLYKWEKKKQNVKNTTNNDTFFDVSKSNNLRQKSKISKVTSKIAYLTLIISVTERKIK